MSRGDNNDLYYRGVFFDKFIDFPSGKDHSFEKWIDVEQYRIFFRLSKVIPGIGFKPGERKIHGKVESVNRKIQALGQAQVKNSKGGGPSPFKLNGLVNKSIAQA